MKDLDLFGGLSPEEVKVLCSSVEGRSKAVSGGVRGYWDNISESRYRYRCEVNNNRWTADERRKAARRSRTQWAGYPEERRDEILGKVFLNEDYRKAFAEQRRNMTPEETKEWTDRSFNNPEARKRAESNMRIGLRKWWASLSKEEKERQISIRVSASRRSNASRPSEPEISLNTYLQIHCPGEWAYNGGMEQGILIGNKIPDFININGKKEVIEVFGTYWHDESEVEEKKAHYLKYGFDCKVIWEYECYDKDDIERILA